MGVPLLAGREYRRAEIHEKRQVAIVAANLAREMWGPPQEALGQQI